jgi:hypothetical protein
VRKSAIKSACSWRRIVAAPLLFALVVQALVLPLANAAAARAIAQDLNWPGFELCQHEPDNAPASSGGSPASDFDCSTHCVLYLSAGAHTLAAPELSVTLLSVVAVAKVRWSLTEWHFPTWSTRDPNARPRGPPLTV